jgi:hypothetical protein
MDKYSLQTQPDTCGLPRAIIYSALLAGAGLVPLGHGTHHMLSLLPQKSVKLKETSQTFSRFSNPFTGEYELSYERELSNLDFENAVSGFYSNLLANQEPLGQEFEKVLHDNLWNLYVRD